MVQGLGKASQRQESYKEPCLRGKGGAGLNQEVSHFLPHSSPCLRAERKARQTRRGEWEEKPWESAEPSAANGLSSPCESRMSHPPSHPSSRTCCTPASAKRKKLKASAPLPQAETKDVVSSVDNSVQSSTCTETLISLPGVCSNLLRFMANVGSGESNFKVNDFGLKKNPTPIIGENCERTQEILYSTKSLNDLGPKEWYVVDVSKESCPTSQNLGIMKEKENKGFSSFFQVNKKKQEQTASTLQYF
ncbi:hypothetical protein HPG69_004111 [Diceros bicornis minor]|uniref:Uncharacterized protein n=1 Tax=Diceros bicornis minor TaxID=77932 RepID=A0A7J7E9V8_DICBM|nr:hypothetical protein HPG69_004111 [Diceros bicornis minor]